MKSFLMNMKRYAPWLKLAFVLAVIIAATIAGGAPDITGI
jgi:hypothetical protein